MAAWLDVDPGIKLAEHTHGDVQLFRDEGLLAATTATAASIVSVVGWLLRAASLWWEVPNKTLICAISQ